MILVMEPRSHSITDLAYCAGIIDGEGSIGIYHRKDRRTYRIGVRVAMCEREAVCLLHEIFGGFLCLKPLPRRSRPNHRPQYEWACAALVASAALTAMLPYLRVKKEQAANALSVQSLNTEIRQSTTLQRKNRKGFGPAMRGEFPIDKRLMAQCDELYLRQKRLNQRGKAA